jgi:hypothetical protein
LIEETTRMTGKYLMQGEGNVILDKFLNEVTPRSLLGRDDP